ncbi:5207_t:CDS:10 [Funneliformis caledonium]|uniref:5207_t:CDS:1 n=1 Tax=Funneliformis caledonium TaxID=1117310 RepID=A0A9N9DW42_9GLOM|nr:5207_t:CDS:10 [Funneliformis caledonium]
MRHKQGKSAVKYIKNKLESDLFTELNSTIQNLKLNNENSQSILMKWTETLDKVLNDNLYQAKNDDISRQHREILEKITSHIISIANFGVSENYSLIFKLFDILLQIEYSIIQQHIDSVWRIILVSQIESADSCVELLKRLLEIYAKSREMNLYIKDLISALSNIQMDANMILKTPLFCPAILDEFSSKVANNVSMPQAIEIITSLTSEVCDVCLSGFIEHSKFAKLLNKRRKLEKERASDVKTVQIIEPLILLMSSFLKALRITVSFKDELEKEFQAIFDRFIYPILSCDYGDKDELLCGKMTYAALSLHHVLVDISLIYWKNTSTPHFMTILCDNTFKNPKSMLFLNKVRLQHVHRSISSINYRNNTNNDSDDSIIILRKLIESVLYTLKEPENLDVGWTGKLVDLDNKNFAVANCMTILGDWLDVVSNVCHEHHLAPIVRFIINWSITCSSVYLQPLKEISVRTLCLQLLKSAEFFELKSLRNIFVKIYLEEIYNCFQHIRDEEMISNGNHKELDMILLISLQGQQSEKSNLMDNVTSCFNNSFNNINQKFCVSLKSIDKIAKFIALLHLFPMEYFTKQEIGNLSLVILLIDKWVSFLKTESYEEVTSTIKCSILCRSLIRKFIAYTNKKDDVLKKDASFIMWWISSINAYQKYITGYTDDLGHDDVAVIQNLFEHFTQITCQTFSLIIRQILVGYPDDDGDKINYLDTFVDYFKNLYDDAEKSIPEMKGSFMSSSNDVRWRFTFEFLSLGIEFAEARKYSKNGRIDRENSVWRLFLTLQSIVKNILNGILSDVLDKSLQEIQNSSDLSWKESLSLELGSMELDKIPDNEVLVLKHCVTLLSVVIDLTSLIEFVFITNISHQTFTLVCDLMNIFYNEGSNREVMKELEAIFNSIISRGSNEIYDNLANIILVKIEDFPFSNDTSKYDLIFLIHLIDVFLRNSNHGKLRRLEQKLPNLLCGICGMAELVDKVTLGIQTLRISKFLVCHRAFSFQSTDIGIVLSIVITLTSPKRHYEDHEYKELFEEICYLLYNILIHRCEQLIHTIPTFIFIIQGMFHCFKKNTRSIKNNLKEIQQKEQQSGNRHISWWEVHLKEPLSIESAKTFARLLTMISHVKKPGNKAFIKHLPSLLSEYIHIQTSNSILELNIKDVLKNGIYSLLDLCGQFERDMIMVSLDLVGKSLFKSLWTEYNKDWKYVGRG